jgi:hypothetical protein
MKCLGPDAIMEDSMRKLLLTTAVLVLGTWAMPAAYAAGEAQQNPTDKSNPAQAVQQGSQDCAGGMMRDASGQCVTASQAPDVPATKHQQELLRTVTPDAKAKQQDKSQ